jgi:hypothetical protein
VTVPKLIVVENNADRVVSLTPKKHGLLSNPLVLHRSHQDRGIDYFLEMV